MKKMHITIVLYAVCLLSNFIAIHAQKAHKKATTQPQQSTTWDGSSWSNKEPTLATKAIIAKDFTSRENLFALEIEVLPNITVRFQDNAILKVVNQITLPTSSRLALEDNSQLLQKNPGAIPPPVDIIRKTTPISKRDYTYFCSPVAGQQLNLITDYSVVGNYNNSNGYLNGIPTPGVYNPPFFEKYYTWNASGAAGGTDALFLNTGYWQNIPETTLMDPPGKGYIVRGPNSFPEVTPKQQWQVKFTGIPNTAAVINTFTTGIPYTPFSGALTPYVPVTPPAPFVPYKPCNNGFYSWNLIGNPYPSMIDADTFLTNPANITNLGGALYFWTHGSDLSAENGGNGTAPLNYTTDDYVTYNLTGGIGGTKRPKGKIATCQGFFTFGLTTNTSATFTTDMRDESLNGDVLINQQQFFRTSSQSMIAPLTKNRIWISLSSSSTVFKETLIGYIPAATTTNGAIAGSVNGYDKMYDTELLKTVYTILPELNNRVELYTLLTPTTPCPRLAIQGRKLDAAFNTNDVVALGFSCPAGTYKIKLEDKDGLFVNQLIWLREQTSPGVYVYFDDVRTTGHSFTSTGDSDNSTRFQIVFTLPSIPSIVFPIVCGTQITQIETNLFTQNVPATTLYSFEVRTGGAFPSGTVLGTYPGNSNPAYPYQFNLNFSPIQPNTTYWIRPASYQLAGQWVYGNTCQITTPPAPTSCIYNPVSGSITTSTWNPIDARIITNQFGLSATSYRFTATVGGIPFGPQVTKANPRFTLRDFGANQTNTNTTFTITVETFWNGAWQLCPTTYTITTANVITRQSENGIDIFEASTYPNPFSDNFKLDINTSSEDKIELAVYDMLGRQMETRTIQVSDLDTQEIGNNYASGVYNLIIKQADNIKTLRVIKR
jgi:Secretion system C-terminal sorting domain